MVARRATERSLGPVLRRLAAGEPFDSAVARVTGLTPGRFELEWRKEVGRHYGLGLWFAAGGFWLLVAVALVVTQRVRRRRDLPRRAALDVGWDVAVSDEASSTDGRTA